jgi:hypothetical protein
VAAEAAVAEAVAAFAAVAAEAFIAAAAEAFMAAGATAAVTASMAVVPAAGGTSTASASAGGDLGSITVNSGAIENKIQACRATGALFLFGEPTPPGHGAHLLPN